MNGQRKIKLDFVGIGAPKCATTWIYECLQEHPQIRLTPKDQEQIVYFIRPNPIEDMEAYSSFLDQGEDVRARGNYHVAYLSDESAAQRIREHNPDIKIIVCVRNPIDRAYSHYRYELFAYQYNWVSFEHAIEEKPEAIIEPGLYYKYLKKFFDFFPKENILVLVYEDIKKDKIGFIRRIYGFLGVDTSFVPPSLEFRPNVTDFKMTKLGSFIHNKIIRPLLERTKWAWRLKQSPWVKKYFLQFTEFYVRKKRPTPPVVEEETRARLRNLYKEDIQHLGKLIGRDLSFWT